MELELPESRKVLRKQEGLGERGPPQTMVPQWTIYGELYFDVLLFFLPSTGITTWRCLWGVKLHLFGGQIWGEMVQKPTKYRKEPYPSIK